MSWKRRELQWLARELLYSSRSEVKKEKGLVNGRTTWWKSSLVLIGARRWLEWRAGLAFEA